MNEKLYGFIKTFTDLFFPRKCVFCGKYLNSAEDTVCENCFPEIKFADHKSIKDEYFSRFALGDYLDDFTSLMIFEKDSPAQEIIHSLKYRKNFGTGKFLGKLIAEFLEEDILLWKPDLLLPVPLHRIKNIERGFNQSEIIAKELSRITKLEINTRLLKRVKYTITQTALRRDERMANLKDAFEIRGKIKPGTKILLLDDVITTGSTIYACAKTLKEAGAGKIFAVSAAVAA